MVQTHAGNSAIHYRNMSTALTPSQIAKLEKLEARIQRGLQTFVEVGDSLRIIRDDKLFSRDFDSFEAYCESKWGWSKRRGNQLIQAAGFVNALPPSLQTAVTTEYDVRELKTLPPAEQKAAIREAKKEGITVAESAKSFQEKPAVIDRKPGTIVPQPKTEPAPELDRIGWPILPDLLPLWNRAVEVVKLMSAVSAIKGALEKAQADEDPLFRPLTAVDSEGNSQSWSGMIANFTNVRRSLKLCIPYAICLHCQGKLAKKCVTCFGRGFVSEHFWEHCIAKEDKAMRLAMIAKGKQ